MTDSTNVRLLRRAVTTISRLAPIYVCIAGFCLSLSLNFPGFMSYDSVFQILEARAGIYSDWHPPVMAFVWHFIDRIIPGPSGMLLLDTALIWVGTYLVSVNWFSNSRPQWLNLTPCLLIFYPPIFGISGAIWKDIFMWGLLICAIGIAGTIKPRSARTPYLLAILLVLLNAAILFRYNAVFAVMPLIALGILQALPGDNSARRIIGAGIVAVLLAVGMLLCMTAANHALTSHKCSPWQQVALFDIAGTIHGVPDAGQQEAMFERVPLNLRDQSLLESLLLSYSPEKYDTLVDHNHPVFRTDSMTDADRSQFMGTWYEVVLQHPLAWFRHRLQFFLHVTGLTSESLLTPVFMEPNGFPSTFAQAYPDKSPDLNRVQTLVKTVLEHLSEQVIFRPWVYLVLAVLVLAVSLNIRLPDRVPIVLIAASGITNELGLLITAPGPDFRYSHYMIYASMLAAMLLLRASTPEDDLLQKLSRG